MAPTSTRRPPLPEPPDTGNRISKQKTVTNKSNITNRPTRSSIMSDDTRRKAEALDVALGISHHHANEIQPTNEIQMEDTLENPSLPTTNTPPKNGIETSNITVKCHPSSSIKENVYIASLDLDKPGPDAQFPDERMSYDDFPSLPGKINETLLSTTEAATQRIIEARNIFGPISNLLDGQCQAIIPDMPARHVSALTDLCEELKVVAKRHFEAYIRGIPFPLTNSEHTDGKTTLRKNGTLKGISQSSFAQVVNSNTHTLPPQVPVNNNDRNAKENFKNSNSDERLFLRLTENDALRTLSGYALQTLLKTKLGSDGQLLANTLPTKTGFALCPTKGNSATLAEKLAATSTLKDKIIERASPWNSYRITNVPRKFGTTNEHLQHHLEPVTITSLTNAITTAVGSSPISVTPSRDNDANPESPTTAWIVRFKEERTPLPRVLFLFGYRTNTKLLPHRPTTVQCTRCWLWHNSRICSSPIRCRLCGSSQHTEQNHQNLCAGPVDHICPPKCIHCHGPHPSDSIKCELRPCHLRVPKTKTQIAAIRQVCAEARLHSQVEAGCRKKSSSENPESINDLPVSQELHNKNTTCVTTKFSTLSSTSPPLANLTQSSNPFETLNNLNDPTITQTES